MFFCSLCDCRTAGRALLHGDGTHSPRGKEEDALAESPATGWKRTLYSRLP